jgi:hypothetical protein
MGRPRIEHPLTPTERKRRQRTNEKIIQIGLSIWKNLEREKQDEIARLNRQIKDETFVFAWDKSEYLNQLRQAEYEHKWAPRDDTSLEAWECPDVDDTPPQVQGCQDVETARSNERDIELNDRATELFVKQSTAVSDAKSDEHAADIVSKKYGSDALPAKRGRLGDLYKSRPREATYATKGRIPWERLPWHPTWCQLGVRRHKTIARGAYCPETPIPSPTERRQRYMRLRCPDDFREDKVGRTIDGRLIKGRLIL